MKAVNLLPPDLRGAAKATASLGAGSDEPGGPGAFVVLGALAFCVLALAGYVLTTNTIKERKAELTELEAKHQAASARASALKPYAEFDAMAQARVATVRELAGVRFDWEQALRDLSRALPNDVTLKSIEGNVRGQENAGGTDATGAAFPSLKLEGCTRSQTGVARLMARLRAVNGITRVSLAKSEKTATADGGPAGAAVTQAASGTKLPCGTGDTPEFALTAYFERATHAAAGPEQSAAPGAAAQPGQSTAQAGAKAATTPPADPGSQSPSTTNSTAQGGGSQ